jgi:hypothetical protein
MLIHLTVDDPALDTVPTKDYGERKSGWTTPDNQDIDRGIIGRL